MCAGSRTRRRCRARETATARSEPSGPTRARWRATAQRLGSGNASSLSVQGCRLPPRWPGTTPEPAEFRNQCRLARIGVRLRNSARPTSSRTARRNSVGLCPVCARKARLNGPSETKPVSWAISRPVRPIRALWPSFKRSGQTRPAEWHRPQASAAPPPGPAGQQPVARAPTKGRCRHRDGNDRQPPLAGDRRAPHQARQQHRQRDGTPAQGRVDQVHGSEFSRRCPVLDALTLARRARGVLPLSGKGWPIPRMRPRQPRGATGCRAKAGKPYCRESENNLTVVFASRHLHFPTQPRSKTDERFSFRTDL
ncbi:hypothetical protein C7455_103380 [Roseicyclus mahoneyensis]|uniref:Uncharacterized protein n=1 Tax=Roseicyclus mahoneyensis TaxID=164332 RepID=A0A316GLR1_9RHOB|nr:hypothetical protein C7455_103380 [Roseicyclus mahoneyensis]